MNEYFIVVERIIFEDFKIIAKNKKIAEEIAKESVIPTNQIHAYIRYSKKLENN